MESSTQTTTQPAYPVRFSVEYPDRALNRLDNAQNSKDFVQALDEFQTAINQGLARMQYAAQGNFDQSGSEQFPMDTGSAPPPPPDGFEVVQ